MTPSDKQMIRTIECIISDTQNIIDVQQASIDTYRRQIEAIKKRNEVREGALVVGKYDNMNMKKPFRCPKIYGGFIEVVGFGSVHIDNLEVSNG